MAASKFDYAQMMTAQAELEKMGKEIADYVLNIATDAGSVIDGCYTGEAADAYKTAFNKVAEAVNIAVTDISTKLNTELAQQQADYANKEQQMVDSVNVPQVDIAA